MIIKILPTEDFAFGIFKDDGVTQIGVHVQGDLKVVPVGGLCINNPVTHVHHYVAREPKFVNIEHWAAEHVEAFRQ
jgi:hypothetical protein